MMSTSDQQLAVPDDLASAQSKLVYLALLELDEATATELQQRLNLPKLTLLSVLDSLTRMDYAERTADGYACQ